MSGTVRCGVLSLVSAGVWACGGGAGGAGAPPPPVPPPAPVASVTVTPAAPGILIGENVQLAAETRDGSGNLLSGRAITWNTSSQAIASVGGSGLVTGNSAGVATI